MDSVDFRRAGHQAIERIAEYYDTISSKPIQSNVEPGFLRAKLPRVAPEDGETWDAIAYDLQTIVEPGLSHWAHPGFMAYFPASSTFEGIIGELYSAAFNGPAFDWVCSPSVTELENVMMDWLVDLLGLPFDFHSGSRSQGGGIIMDSTTECLIGTMVAARNRFLQRAKTTLDSIQLSTDENNLLKRMVVLGSSETHAATKKAANIIGVGYKQVKCCPKDGVGMTESNLRQLLAECEAENLIPFFLTATFGTTNSCAVDDFQGIANIVKQHPDLWVHVDAAFAGAALICEEYRDLLAGAQQFDSISTNLGKWFLTNLDSTALLVRRHTELTDALQNSCAILNNEATESGRVIDYRNWQLSMGRRFRALKVWFVLRSWGRKRIQAHIRGHIAMGQTFTSWLASRKDLFRIVAKPQFALNVFEASESLAKRADLSVEQLTAQILERVNATNEVWLSKTTLEGRPVIRLISANPKANEDTLQKAFCLLVTTAESFDLTSTKQVNVAENQQSLMSVGARPLL